MNPTFSKYITMHNLQKNKMFQLKVLRSYGILLSLILVIIIYIATGELYFIFILPIAILYDILITPKTLFIEQNETVHELSQFKQQIFNKSDYLVKKYFIFNKKNKKIYYLINVDKKQKKEISRVFI